MSHKLLIINRATGNTETVDLSAKYPDCEFMIRSDSLSELEEFVARNLVFIDSASVPTVDVYRRYHELYCGDRRKAVPITAIVRYLKSLGVLKRVNRVECFMGVRLK
ncbi:hypothetical protein NVP1046O_84 [Vibrio phage 1.046.O._10N.286.52.E3]|nr:hypothetical protein NVP1046O_84 [Vibrio phage 1.046.O._10N.286.52.E3]